MKILRTILAIAFGIGAWLIWYVLIDSTFDSLKEDHPTWVIIVLDFASWFIWYEGIIAIGNVILG